MTQEVRITQHGRAGRITLTRPAALNALSYDMVAAIDAALIGWRDDCGVEVVIIDAEGPRAFCAGGDVADLYRMGCAGDLDGPRRYWRDEYRMNRRIAEYPKPIVAFMQGFVMGGGVGLGCHASHRIVGESTRMAMPECGIGLVPDVGGTHLLAAAPGSLGDYLGLSGGRMEPGDTLYAGFADHFVPEADWPALIVVLEQSADVVGIPRHTAPQSPLAAHQAQIDVIFGAADLGAIVQALGAAEGDFAQKVRADLGRGSPLSMLASLALIRAARLAPGVAAALEREFRFTARAVECADFIEGVRAQLIDKDRSPKWRHAAIADVTQADLGAMMAPLGPEWSLWADRG